jgi:hypothetical protein
MRLPPLSRHEVMTGIQEERHVVVDYFDDRMVAAPAVCAVNGVKDPHGGPAGPPLGAELEEPLRLARQIAGRPRLDIVKRHALEIGAHEGVCEVALAALQATGGNADDFADQAAEFMIFGFGHEGILLTTCYPYRNQCEITASSQYHHGWRV